MTAGDELPPVLPSGPDDEYECVLVDPEAARAPSKGEPGESLCPPGYVPRLKRRTRHRLQGKEVASENPPEENPQPPPAD